MRNGRGVRGGAPPFQKIRINCPEGREEKKMKRVILFSLFAIVLFVACEGPAGPPGPAGEDGAWQIIETIEVTSPTKTITFEEISDEWDILEIRAWGVLNGVLCDTCSNMYLRVNNDSISSYSWRVIGGGGALIRNGENEVFLGEWRNGVASLQMTIYPENYVPGHHSFTWVLEADYLSNENDYGVYGTGSHFDTYDQRVHQIDIYVNPTSSKKIYTGSEFVLLGLDTD